jgi:signal transduction histidine kinase
MSLQWSLASLADGSKEPENSRNQFDECMRMVRDCIEEVRTVSGDLQPPVLDMLGLVPAMQSYAKKFAERSGLQIAIEAPPELERLPGNVELSLFRVLEECLSNLRLHAQTGLASVRLRCDGDGDDVILEIEHGGASVPRDLLTRLEGGGFGAGLLKLRERLGAVKGTLETVSNGNGTIVRARVPRRVPEPVSARAAGPLAALRIQLSRRSSTAAPAVARASGRE